MLRKYKNLNLEIYHYQFIKRTILTILAVLLMSVTVYADEADQLSTVYHVYVDQEYIGKVDDQAVIQTVIDDKLVKGQQQYENLDIVIGESISYIQEKVFNPKYNNEKVINELEEKLTVKAETMALQIEGDVVGHFKDEETAKEVIRSYKAKFVSEDVLKALEDDKKEIPKELKLGDSIVEEVSLSKEISFIEDKINPSDILNKESGLKLLEKGTIEEKVHKVQEGEVLGAIANQYDLSIDKLLKLNPSLNEDSLLQIDQEIHVTEAKPLVHVIVKEKKKVEENISYETEIIESKDMYEGEEKVRQKGEDGTKEVLYKLELVNGQVAHKEVTEEKVTKEPTKEIVVKGTKIIPSRGTGNLTWPAIGGYVSSYKGQRWGRTHKGIDIARPSNRAILAADHGVVASAGYNSGGYGNKIVINHNNGMKTIYAHLDSISVKPGQKVEKGMKIGVMGSTGRSTGVHLHFEVYKNGKLKDPMSYLK